MSIAFFDWMRGTGKYAVSVPAMDGALKPNDAIDASQSLHECRAPDNLVMHDGTVHLSSGKSLLRFSHAGVDVVAECPREISCMASLGPALAIGLEEGGLQIRGGAFDGLVVEQVADRRIVCPAAALFEADDTVLLCLGSQQHPPSRWRWDLLEGNSSGSVWRIHLRKGHSVPVCDKLAFPYGIAMTSSGKLLVCESWRHRIVEVSGAKLEVLVDELPFYPARLQNTAQGDFLVCGFAPRRQLVEFLLHEREFLARMMTEVPERYWMAPALSSNQSFLEPLQGGQIRHHGILKPWSPTKSYGLLARMDQSGRFLESYHCRAGGSRHGITSAIDAGTNTLTTAKGGGFVLAIAH